MISVISTSTGFRGTNAASVVVNRPAGVVAGDYLVAAVRSQSNVSTADITSPGFTRISTAFVPSSAQGRVTGLFLHRVTADDPTSYTFTHTGANGRWAAAIMAVRITGSELVVVGTSSPYEGVSATNGRGTSAFTATDAGLEVWMSGAELTSPISNTPATLPDGYTQAASVPSGTETTVTRTYAWLGWREVAAGTVPAASMTWSANPTGAAAQAVVLHEVPLPDGPVTVGLWNGTTEVEHKVYAWDGTQESSVTDILVLDRKSYTVSDMEADIAAGRDVYWAHRGGSLNWSEMTMRAYTNATWHGSPALEISVCRSADGVYIMSHDPTLDRVTGTSLGPISSVDSSAMLGLPVTVPVGGGVVGRLESVLDAYRDMLLVVDDKTGVNYPAFLALLNTVPNAAEHVIVKIDGSTSFTRFQAAQAAGFKTAAYFYGDTPSSRIVENMPYVDYPGMNYDAAQSAWDAILAYGKPVWGHVLPNTAAKATAKAKGATIFQCADVLSTIPQVNPLP